MQDCLVRTPLRVQAQAEAERERVRADRQPAAIQAGRVECFKTGRLPACFRAYYYRPRTGVPCYDAIIPPSGHSDL